MSIYYVLLLKIMRNIMNKALVLLLVSCLLLTSCNLQRKDIDYLVINRETITVPNVIGEREAESKRILKEAGFSNVIVSFEKDADLVVDSSFVVIEQSLRPGARVQRDDEIILTLKKVINYIDVVNLPISDAREKLLAAGFQNIQSNIDEHALSHEIEKWIVTEQSALPSQEMFVNDKIDLVCKRKCHVRFSLSSDSHWFLNTYPVDIYIDGHYVDEVRNGYTLSWEQDLLSGDHIIMAENVDNETIDDSYTVYIDDDIDISANIAHESSYLSIYNLSESSD